MVAGVCRTIVRNSEANVPSVLIRCPSTDMSPRSDTEEAGFVKLMVNVNKMLSSSQV